jgi:hypothetical protein
MSNLSVDILWLIFEELQYERKILYSCLLVNRTWCKIIIPILWRDPWNSQKFIRKNSIRIIISFLSNEAKEILRNQNIIYVPTSQRPLFNYVSYCKSLNLSSLYAIIYQYGIRRSDAIHFLINEILKLFINENNKLIHLYLTHTIYNYQIPLIPGADHCFSKLEFLHCYTKYDQDILEWLSKTSKSVKILEFKVYDNHDISGIIIFIEAQKKLTKIIWHNTTTQKNPNNNAKLLAAIFSKQNLISLDIDFYYAAIDWEHLKNLSLPDLKFLTVNNMRVKDLASLINKTKGCLTEIKLDNSYDRYYDDRHTLYVQSIYQNCPNLRYLKLILFDESFNGKISDFEILLTNCNYLEGLIVDNSRLTVSFGLDNFYKILTKSSPTSLFKFKIKFSYYICHEKESLVTFFNNWKGRNPMLLQATYRSDSLSSLIKKYVDKGIVKSYVIKDHSEPDNFEW